jgi:hypothetical protein
VNVKLFYSGGPLDGLTHEIDTSPVSATPPIVFADYSITPVVALRPDEEQHMVMETGTYLYDHTDAEQNLYYTWQG